MVAENDTGHRPFAGSAMETAPRDGSHFLAWVEVIADELDEDGRVIKRGVIDRYQVIAYYVLGGFVEFPWRGTFVTNMRWKCWRPLPEDPEPRHG